MKKTSIFIIAAAVMPSAAVWADANPDASFYKNAAEGGISEVELGNLAQKKATSDAVKDFAAMMVADHSKANEKLQTLAMGKEIKLPTSASLGQMGTKAKLEVLSGKTFDQSYIKGMIEDHEEDIKEFNNEATSGKDPAARAYAKSTLPTLKKHLRKIRSIAAAEGVTDK